LLFIYNPIYIRFKNGLEDKFGYFLEEHIILEHELNFLY
jgi:hypothetical protein